jgi:CRISPR-associated protein Csd2
MAAAIGPKDGATVEEYQALEETTPEDALRTMGRKQLIPFGLYEVRGFVSANLAAETHFDDDDLKHLFEAILNMYEHDRSASKGEMEVVSPLIIFKHVGTDSDPVQRTRQAKLGCAPAHRLFELVHVEKKKIVEYPRSYRDYEASVNLAGVPAGVEIGFQRDAFGEISWGALPKGETWLRNG